jgi:enoyl-CoA hydratase/carnithine racemase
VLNGLIGQRALTELCITGEPITAQQALALGLINHVSEDLDAGVQACWIAFSTSHPPPSAVACIDEAH